MLRRRNFNKMLFPKIIFNMFFVFKFVNADAVICENNECKRVGVINTDSLYYELDTIKESNRNMTIYLKELNDRIDHKISTLTTEIENMKEMIYDQVNKPITYISENTSDIEIDNSLYDNLWIVIQTRQDGSVNFYNNWTEYKQGFGDQFGEFFVGLDKIYNLTNSRHHELLIMLEDFFGTVKFAHYDHFLIGSESERYRLKKLGKYFGTAGNHLKFHLNRRFSTKDKDNDDSDEGNCAHWFKGAWWYYNCMTSNLNGPYKFERSLDESERGVGITWGSFDDIIYSYKGVQMLLRPKE